MNPANSSYVSRAGLRSIINAEKRPISDDALVALLKKIEDEQCQGMDLFNNHKASMKPLSEPLKSLTQKLKINEELLERMYEAWKTTSNAEYEESVFLGWVEQERLAFMELNCDLVRLYSDKQNALSKALMPIIDRLVGKKLHTKTLCDIATYASKEDLACRFETLHSLLRLLFLFLYEKLRKEHSFAKEVIGTIAKVFSINYSMEHRKAVNDIHDLAVIICIEVLDFESLFGGYQILSSDTEVNYAMEAWGLKSDIGAQNSAQALALSTWCVSAHKDVDNLATRAYNAGCFYRLQAIVQNQSLLSQDSLMLKGILNDFIMMLLSTFDLKALGQNFKLVVELFSAVVQEESKIADSFWTNEAFEFGRKNLFDTLGESFPLHIEEMLTVLTALSTSKESAQRVLEYFSTLEILCVNRTPDRGSVLETFKEGMFNLVVSRNLEVFCEQVGFYLLAGTKGVSFESDAMAGEVPMVRWQVEQYSGWHYLTRLMKSACKDIALKYAPIVCELIHRQVKHLGPIFIKHIEEPSPLYSQVKTPRIDCSVVNLLIRLRDEPQAVYSALCLLTELELGEEGIRELKTGLGVLLSVFYLDELVTLPKAFCTSLCKLSEMVFGISEALGGNGKRLVESFVKHLMSSLTGAAKFEDGGLDDYISTIFLLASAIGLQDKTIMEMSVNCVKQQIGSNSAVKYITSFLSKEFATQFIDYELVEKALESRESIEFIKVCLAKKHLPLSNSALSKLSSVVLQDANLLTMIVEGWQELSLALFTRDGFEKELVSLMTDVKLKGVSVMLKLIWDNPQVYYSTILKLREYNEFWKCIEVVVAKGEASNEVKANMVRIYTRDLLLFKKAAFKNLLLAIDEDALGELMERPHLGTALIELMAALCECGMLEKEMQGTAVSAACRYILSHVDDMSGSAFVILGKLRGDVPWEAFTKIFIERLSRENIDLAEDFFQLVLDQNVRVEKSLLISCLSQACHANAQRAVLSLLRLLIREGEEDVQVIHVIQRDRVLPLLMRTADVQMIQCLTECCARSRGFRELAVRSGVIFSLPTLDMSAVLDFYGSLAQEHWETAMGALGMVGFANFSPQLCQLCDKLLTFAAMDSPVTHAFVSKMLPHLFLQLRMLSLQPAGSDGGEVYAGLLKRVSEFVPREVLKEGIECLREPPVRYADILRRFHLEHPHCTVPILD